MQRKYWKINVFSLLIAVNWLTFTANDSEWTRTFYKKIALPLENKHAVITAKEDVMPFTQLVFSWNGIRPKKGYLSFFASVRNANTKKWGVWHPMMDWGSTIQRSYTSSSDKSSHYLHVRLEADSGVLLDGFRIKATAHEGADLYTLKGVAVVISNAMRFNSESAWHLTQKLSSSIYLEKVPFKSQFLLEHPHSDRICSPTSMSLVVEYLCKQKIDTTDFTYKVFDAGLQAYGSWPFNTAHAYTLCAGSHWFFITRFHSFNELYRYLLRNIPVVVSIRGPLAGAARPYANGHLLVVVGYDAKTHEVICRDPAFDSLEKAETRYKLADFLVAWERSKRLAYIAEPEHNIK